MSKNQLPEGITFADAESEGNYQKALAGDLNEYGFKPIVVITSRGPGKGKTRLAKSILEARYGSSFCPHFPKTEAGMRILFPEALECGYLFFDDVKALWDSAYLMAIITSKEWSFRRPYSNRITTSKVDLQVIVTGNDLEISDLMARRSIRIELV